MGHKLFFLRLFVRSLDIPAQSPQDIPPPQKDGSLYGSFLLTIEVFLLTVRLLYLRWGNRKSKRPNPISRWGEP